jgi:nucleoside-diphosphate kinase
MEKTLVLVKPDGVQRGLAGEIISRLERRGLKLCGMKFIQMSRQLASVHYEVHKERPFYNSLVEYITSGPVVAMVWEGKDAIQTVRTTM